MKRKILFRGKSIHSEEWLYGNLIIANNGQPYIIPSEVFEPDGHHIIINSDMPFWVIPDTVGQFTGKTDKNGKMIWEGDIVAPFTFQKRREWRLTVIYKDGQFVVDKKYAVMPDFMPLKYLIDRCKNANNEIEVIGNIYDNPELL